jgi:4'-phosphopantetheinyl transferase
MGIPDSQIGPSLITTPSNPSERLVRGYFCRTDHVSPEDVVRACVRLSDEERARSAQFGFESDRRDYTFAHLLLRVVLAGRLGCSAADVPIRAGRLGKPEVAGVPWTVSLSHARGLVACAVAPHGWLGLDVEAINPAVDLLRVAHEYFTPADVAVLEQSAGEARVSCFYEMWTLKESLLKATGLTAWELRGASFERANGRITLTGSAGVSVDAWQCLSADVGGHFKLAIVAGGVCRVDFLIEEIDSTLLLNPGPGTCS